jgi:hypothetical protein
MASINKNVKVVVRCRPLNAAELERNEASIVTTTATSVTVDHEDMEEGTMTFDHCYGDHVTNQEIYETVGEPLVVQAFDGYTAAVFTIGEIGSGKTFTMYGNESSKGVALLMCESLLEMTERERRQQEWRDEIEGTKSESKYTITLSFVGIAEHGAWDLLAPSADPLQLEYLNDNGRIVIAPGLTDVVSSWSMSHVISGSLNCYHLSLIITSQSRWSPV